MLATVLPGLRDVRAPLAAGLVLLVVGWFLLAPVLPPPAEATGVIADGYRLIDAVGKPVALAGAAFVGYVLGIFCVTAMNGAIILGNLIVSKVPVKYQFINPGSYRTRAVINSFDADLLCRLGERYLADSAFRDSVNQRVASVYEEAQRGEVALHGPFEKWTSDQLLERAGHSARIRVQILEQLVERPDHINDLAWELHVAGPAAVDLPDVFDAQERHRAEGQFRSGLVIPVVVLAIVLAIRVSAWFLLLGLAALALVYFAQAQYNLARYPAIRAILDGRHDWPPIDRVVNGPIIFRQTRDVLTTPAKSIT